jgi:peptidoglycan/LPS O-acetylase OafA/YrhL
MRRMIELDGLRGLACLSVLIAHYFGEVAHGWHFLALGWAGVDLFFCLSGFLVGGILLDNRDFSTFYIRRGFRIFPVYYVTISLVLIATLWQRTGHPQWIDPALPAISYYTYSQNLLFAVVGDPATAWLLPTWTLCVEEQFYRLLPLILYLVPARKLRGALLLLIVSASLSRLMLALFGANDMALHVLLPSRWDLLFLGVLGAYLHRDQRLRERLTAGNSHLLKWAVAFGAAASVALAVIDRHLAIRSLDLVGPLFVGICCVSFLLLVISGAIEGARFRSKTLCWFGTISYGLYLVHQPIAGLLHGFVLGNRPDIATPLQVLLSMTALALSIAVASVSWRFLERPLVELGHRWRYDQARRPVIAVAQDRFASSWRRTLRDVTRVA